LRSNHPGTIILPECFWRVDFVRPFIRMFTRLVDAVIKVLCLRPLISYDPEPARRFRNLLTVLLYRIIQLDLFAFLSLYPCAAVILM
jgi:hypothetical protein